MVTTLCDSPLKKSGYKSKHFPRDFQLWFLVHDKVKKAVRITAFEQDKKHNSFIPLDDENKENR